LDALTCWWDKLISHVNVGLQTAALSLGDIGKRRGKWGRGEVVSLEAEKLLFLPIPGYGEYQEVILPDTHLERK
jgi:hypothetical protein